MAALTLVGAAFMGLLMLVVVLAIARGMDWRSNEIFSGREGEEGLLASLAASPAVWVIAFLVVSLGLTAVAIVGVGGFGISPPGGVALAVAPFALLLFAYLIGGTYAAARDRNVSPAGATLVVAILLGTLLLVAIGTRLLMGP